VLRLLAWSFVVAKIPTFFCLVFIEYSLKFPKFTLLFLKNTHYIAKNIEQVVGETIEKALIGKYDNKK